MAEITNAIRKTVKSLATTKGRRTENAFAVEGTKSVLDILSHFQLLGLYGRKQWLEEHDLSGERIFTASGSDLERMTSLATAPDVIAVFRIPESELPTITPSGLYLALNGVQDPGNLGTIVRLADWFGVTDIFASKDTVDIFNPKAVMATMGSIARVHVHYVDLPAFLSEQSSMGIRIFGTFLDGQNIYETDFTPAGIIVMGNEGRGISQEVEKNVTERLLIPTFPPSRSGAESLNVAMATSITLAEFRRRTLYK